MLCGRDKAELHDLLSSLTIAGSKGKFPKTRERVFKEIKQYDNLQLPDTRMQYCKKSAMFTLKSTDGAVP